MNLSRLHKNTGRRHPQLLPAYPLLSKSALRAFPLLTVQDTPLPSPLTTSIMTRSVKRSVTTSSDRARPPKRRKTAGVGAGKTIDVVSDLLEGKAEAKGEAEEVGASEQSTQEDEVQWPANRILDERVRGTRKQYLVEWEPNPVDGSTYNSTWVGRARRTR